MAEFYKSIPLRTKGAWVVHHGFKTSGTTIGGSEFSALDAAGKAASLLSQMAATDQTIIDKTRVSALAQAAGLNPRIELPTLLKILERQRVISLSSKGDVEVLGLTSAATVQHAATIFEDQEPTSEERASIALAEVASSSPVETKTALEFISDEFTLTTDRTREFLARAETVGFVDSEGRDSDKLYFNGNLFRRDNLAKIARVLDSLSPSEKSLVAALDAEMGRKGCLGLSETERILGVSLFEKLRAAGMYDVCYVANPSGEFGFVTRPAAFHKYNDPMGDDAFDLAKALVAALSYGMSQSTSGRGKIEMIGALLGKLISGGEVGPATAIGEDYRVLETKGVIQVKPASRYGYTMKLLKVDIGEMALKVLTTGEASSTNAIDRPLPGRMTGFSGPEKTRSDFRRKQIATSRSRTRDILETLRTRGAWE